MKRFKDKTAFITGAARGVGKETVLSFLKEGANVVAVDINKEMLEGINDPTGEDGGKILILKTDITDSKDVQKAIKESVNRFGQINCLVNNAGITMTKEIWGLEKEDWDRVLDVNVKGTFDVMQKTARHMAEKKIQGSIVNIASIAGEKGRPDFLAYAASKAAVISITKSAAIAFADKGIRVNSVSPGTVDTPMWEKVAEDIIKIKGGDKQELLKSWIEKIPLKRLARPEDISDMILFLCSDSATFITGQTFNVCGGLSLL